MENTPLFKYRTVGAYQPLEEYTELTRIIMNCTGQRNDNQENLDYLNGLRKYAVDHHKNHYIIVYRTGNPCNIVGLIDCDLSRDKSSVELYTVPLRDEKTAKQVFTVFSNAIGDFNREAKQNKKISDIYASEDFTLRSKPVEGFERLEI